MTIRTPAATDIFSLILTILTHFFAGIRIITVPISPDKQAVKIQRKLRKSLPVSGSLKVSLESVHLR